MPVAEKCSVFVNGTPKIDKFVQGEKPPNGFVNPLRGKAAGLMRIATIPDPLRGNAGTCKFILFTAIPDPCLQTGRRHTKFICINFSAGDGVL